MDAPLDSDVLQIGTPTVSTKSGSISVSSNGSVTRPQSGAAGSVGEDKGNEENTTTDSDTSDSDDDDHHKKKKKKRNCKGKKKKLMIAAVVGLLLAAC